MKMDQEDFMQLISELSENANDVNEEIRRNDNNPFLLGKREAYRETFEVIKEITELTDHEIKEIRKKSPSYRSISFETLDGISPELLKCFRENNIHTVGQLSKYNGQDIFLILNEKGNNVASLLLLYLNNSIPTKYLNDLANIADEHREKQIEQMEKDLNMIKNKLSGYSRHLNQLNTNLDQISSELEELYTVTAIDFSDTEGNKSEDENASMRILTITNSKEERSLLLSAEEVKSLGISLDSVLTFR